MNLKNVRNFLVVIFVAGMSFVGGSVYKERQLLSSSNVPSEVNTKVMNNVLERLKKDYLKPEAIDAKKLMYGAAEGMTASLGDPYTAFFPPVENTRSKEDLKGEFGGVGIQLGYVEKTLAVMSPIKDSPAAKAGIVAGDLILKIVDEAKGVKKDTSGIGLEEAVNLIRGEKGTTVKLTIFSVKEKQSKEIALVRDMINVPSTELEWIDNGKVAVIRVNKFGEKTLPEWEGFVKEILAKKATGVILDVRNNPGGYLQRAVDLGSEFISDGVIVSQRDRKGTESLNVDRKGKLIGMPLVVLINKGSASASEILAGALKERLGVKLVGEKSFGKGTVQEAQEIGDGSSLHVTIAEWLLPSGKNIHGDGLEPDVKVEFKYNEKDPKADNQLEKALEVLKELKNSKTQEPK